MTTCWCGHARDIHAHYTRATNCVQCACPWWRPRWMSWAWTTAGLVAAFLLLWWVTR